MSLTSFGVPSRNRKSILGPCHPLSASCARPSRTSTRSPNGTSRAPLAFAAPWLACHRYRLATSHHCRLLSNVTSRRRPWRWPLRTQLGYPRVLETACLPART